MKILKSEVAHTEALTETLEPTAPVESAAKPFNRTALICTMVMLVGVMSFASAAGAGGVMSGMESILTEVKTSLAGNLGKGLAGVMLGTAGLGIIFGKIDPVKIAFPIIGIGALTALMALAN